MKIAIIGAGNVGGALGKQLVAKGNMVFYGVPTPTDPKYKSLKSENSVISHPAAAVKETDIVFLATPWQFTKQAIDDCGNLDGKILIDCTNPINADFSGLEIGQTTSGGETVAKWAKNAKVVKCFNQTGFENMNQPNFNGQKIVMFAAGDDPEAVKLVASLAHEIGFDAYELKGLQMARQLEQLAWLWIAMAYKQGFSRNFGFSMLKR